MTPAAKPLTTLIFHTRVDCIDGVAGYLDSLISGLAGSGDGVLLVTGPVTTPDGSETRRNAIRASVLDWIVMEDLQAVPRPMQVRRILRLMREHGVGLIATQGFTLLPYAKLLARLSGLRVVANHHPSAHGTVAAGVAPRRPLKARLAYRAVCTLFPADRYIAISREVEAFYQDDCGISRDRVHYQVTGIDDAIYRAPSAAERRDAREALGLSPQVLATALVGRLNLVKGHDVAVDAIRLLRRDRPDLAVKCLFAGAGSQRAEIEAYAHRDDADRAAFVFLGFVNTDAALRDIYWAADVLLLPSRREGFPLVVPQAMCCGAVPIRTPGGGCEDQIEDGVTGFVVPFNDPPALAARIGDLADTARRNAMREQAVAFASARFTLATMIERMAKLFHDVASGAG